MMHLPFENKKLSWVVACHPTVTASVESILCCLAYLSCCYLKQKDDIDL